MQDLELESLCNGVGHSQMVKDHPIANDSGSRDCVKLPSPTAGFRFNPKTGDKDENDDLTLKRNPLDMSCPYVNHDMRKIRDLPLGNSYKPSEVATSRAHWSLESNLTPSVRDEVFQAQRENFINNATTKKQALGPVTAEIEDPEEAALLTDQCGRMIFSQAAIENHMEERIAAFLMQLIDCYDTTFHYTIGKTQDQTESTPPIHFKLAEGLERPPQTDLKMSFASAHHGTIPCIWSYPREEWERWKALNNPNAGEKPQAKIHLNKSDTYYANNACTGLATEINRADIDVDGNDKEADVEFGPIKAEGQQRLRHYSIGLLNRVAKKELNPIQGFGLYMAKLKTLIKNLNDAQLSPEKRVIFETWKKVIEEFEAIYEGDYRLFISKLLGIYALPTAEQGIDLDKVVYPRHYHLLKTKNTYQTELAFRIDDLKAKILALRANKPRNFDKAFKLALMSEAGVQKERVRMVFQRHYNCNGETLESLKHECEHTCKPALALVTNAASKKLIEEFFVTFAQYLHNFTIDQAKFSAELVSSIRKSQNLSLRAFSTIYNVTFPNVQRLNYEQLRRIELSCVEPSKPMIERLAKVLHVHPTVLISTVYNF